MSFDPNDPRFTAYSLGELDEVDRLAVEAELARDGEALAFVEGVRELASILSEELRRESAPALGSELTQVVERELIGDAVAGRATVAMRPRSESRGSWAPWIGLAAGVVTLVGGVGLYFSQLRDVALGPMAVLTDEAAMPPAAESAPASRPMGDVAKLELPAQPKSVAVAGRASFSIPPAPSSVAASEPSARRRLAARAEVRASDRFTDELLSRGDAAAPSGPAAANSAYGRGIGGPSSGAAASAPADKLAFAAKPASPLAGGMIASVNDSERGRQPARPAAGRIIEDQAGVALAPADAAQVTTPQLVQVEKKLAEQEERLKLDPAPALPQIAPIVDNPFVSVVGNELSTFAIDVDTGSYPMVRRFLEQGQAPPKDAVRIEEMLNYFPYGDPGPKDGKPFDFNIEIADCPWNSRNRLARIGIKAQSIDPADRPPSNLVFLIDVSGSMSDLNKLPLLKAGMKLLVDQLSENDRVSIVTYAGNVRVHLPSTPCHRKKLIIDALDTLQAGGSTAGAAGIDLAYQEATAHFIKGGTNRVILATDGDFNVGRSKEELLAESEKRTKSGIFLTVLGFGEGNLQEAFMEQLADKGNGRYAYIDTIAEARKVLVSEMSGTLVTVAKDVKIQVEFNPAKIRSYRLIGYENRVMAAADFRNDAKDAGEIGAGHGVTALYEIEPASKDDAVAAKVAAGAVPGAGAVGPLKYRTKNVVAKEVKTPAPAAESSPESLTVFLRYKAPDGDKALELERGVVDAGLSYGRASNDFKFAAAVAGFGMLLRDSPHKGSLTFSGVSELAELAKPASLVDPSGYRAEFVEMVEKAKLLLDR